MTLTFLIKLIRFETWNPFFKSLAQNIAMSSASNTENLDIDDALEKKAAENNLSVINVKSIIHVRALLILIRYDIRGG